MLIQLLESILTIWVRNWIHFVQCIQKLRQLVFFCKVRMHSRRVASKQTFLMHHSMERCCWNIDCLTHVDKRRSGCHRNIRNSYSQFRPIPHKPPSPVHSILLKEQYVSNNIVNIEISIVNFLFILHQKRAIALCVTENSLAALAIAPLSCSPSFHQPWR